MEPTSSCPMKADGILTEWRRLVDNVIRAELDSAEDVREAALEDAVGSMLVTDLLLPLCPPVDAAAVVWRGKLVGLCLSDSACQLSPSACEWLINGVVGSALVHWHQEYLGRLGGIADPFGEGRPHAPREVGCAMTEPVAAPGLLARCVEGLPMVAITSEDIDILTGEELATRVLSLFGQLEMTVSTD